MVRTATWRALAEAEPDLAESGRRLLYQGGPVATGFLATSAPTGPRVHPVFPVLTDDELWLFIVNLSPKYRDLSHNGQFALHSAPTPEGGEEFHLRGRATEVTAADVRAGVIAATAGRQGTHEFEALFRCELSSALYTRWERWGSADTWPEYHKWRPDGSPA